MTIFFFICSQLTRYPLIELFHLSNLLQMLNNGRMVNAEFSGNFSRSCSGKISFSDPLSQSLSTSDGWPLCSSTSRLSSPPQNSLNHHCTVCLLAVPGPDALWCCKLSPLLYNSFWTQIKKLLGFAFCPTSFFQPKININ